MADLRARFLELHRPDPPLLLPNPWDAGSARLLESLGFQALATTSSGYAATLGRLDGKVTRDEALEHARVVVEATGVPVSADLENGFADDPDGVAETIRLAIETGLAGCSVEDYTGADDDSIYPLEVATERVRAAVEAADAAGFVITARAENHIHGRDDLPDTIARLQSFQEAGAARALRARADEHRGHQAGAGLGGPAAERARAAEGAAGRGAGRAPA